MLELNISRRELLLQCAQVLVGTTLAIDSLNKNNAIMPVPIEVQRYYPELSQIPITGRGGFRTNNGRFRWLNTSPLKFNEEAAKQLFRYYEIIAKSGNLGISFDAVDRRVDVLAKPLAMPEANIFIVDSNHPLPSWAPGDYRGVTDIRPLDSSSISVIRTLSLQSLFPQEQKAMKSDHGFATMAFAGEAANLSFVVVDRRGVPDRLGQEAFINSLARFVTARIMGATYNEYLESVIGFGAFIPNLGHIPFIPLPENDYRRVQLPSPIFT